MKVLSLKHLVVSVAVLLMMILFSACAGVGNSQQTLTGSIVSVNNSTHTVVINVNGTQDTISNVPNNVIQFLSGSGQIGKTYTFQVTTNSDGTFSIVGGTTITDINGTPEVSDTSTTDETPTTNETPTTVEPGSIEFFGQIQVSSNSSVTVSMPDDSQLSMTVNSATNLSDFNNAIPAIGTQVKAEASTNPDGSFTATRLGNVDATDTTNQVTFTGVTTAAVGSDNVIHFTVGNKRYSFTITPGTTDLGDFNNSAQQIQSGTQVKVEVQYNSATNVTVLKVSNAGS